MKRNSVRYQSLILSLLVVGLIGSISISGWLYDKPTQTSTMTVTDTSSFGVTKVIPSTITAVVGVPTTTTATITRLSYVTEHDTASLYIVPPIKNVVISNISISGYAWSVGVDPDTNMIYSVGPFSSVAVIDGYTNQAFRIIAAPNSSAFDTYHVAVNTKTDVIYAGGDIIDGATNTLVGHLGDNVSDVAVDSNADLVYATSTDFAPPGNSSLLIFNGATNALVGKIVLNASLPASMAVDPDTHMVYLAVCTQFFVCAPSYVYAINGTSETLVSKMLIGSNPAYDIPSDLAVDPARNMLYVATDQLDAINLTLDRVVQKTNLSAYDIECQGLAINEGSDEVYVTASSVDNSSTFFIINGANYAVMNAFVDNSGPQGVAYDPTNSEIYVADTGTNSILALISSSYLLP